MNQMKIALALCAALMLIITIPAASAITVDGYNDTGEWDVNWAFGQNNNLSHTYDPEGPFGDRMEVRQGGVNILVTSEWNMIDPKNDSGKDFDDSMASAGESSGSDISKIYAHYDMVNDTLYGMSEVYGIPGDYDGDGDVSNTSPDTIGAAGPAGSGLGVGESWTINLYQDSNYSIITVSNNDWSVDTNTGMTYSDVDARLSNDAVNSVYEISISNFSNYFTLVPGATFEVQIAAGATPDQVGEDFGSIVFQIPEPGIDIEKSTNGDDADTPTGPFIPVGDDVEWVYNVTNTGNIPLANITVTDDKGVTAVYQSGDDGDNILQTDEVWIYNATGISVAGQYKNNATVTGEYGLITVTDEDPSHYFGVNSSIDIEKATNGEDADTPTGPYVTVGGDVVWTYNVTNTGNSNLTDIMVQDNMGVTPSYVSGDTNDDLVMEPGEVWMYNATGTAEEGQYANLGNVTGTDPTEADVTDEDPSHYFGSTPLIDIEKSTNGDDADTPTGPFIPVGDDVEWVYNVTNTGNVNLSSIDVQDNITGVTPAYLSGDTNDDGIMEPGEVWMYNATGIAEEGQYANLGNVTGTPEVGENVTDEDPSHYFGSTPLIDIEKSTNGDDADTPTGPLVPVGDDVEWVYNVTNTGNVNLSSIDVQDNITGVTPAYLSGDTNDDGIMEPGEVWMYNATGIAEEGQYANLGNVTGTPEVGENVTDEDPSHYFGSTPLIDIEKSTNGDDADTPTGPLVPVGDDVEWVYNVTNTGNVNLSSIDVQDNITGVTPAYLSGDTNDDGILEPGEVWMYNATGIAEEGQYANLGNVTGTDPTEADVTDEDPSHYFGSTPLIDIEKSTNGDDADTPTGPLVPVGADVEWVYNVTNTGNVNLSSIDVQDNITGVTPAYLSGDTNDDGILEPGEVWMYNATGIAEEGQYANLGNVTGTDPTEADVTDEDPSHYFGSTPLIDIEKSTN
ncbi:hypothetical protein, partial [Methanohalophilus sp. RSK]|uniref:DUF7507 domain-containing protein n=1 Tax=Methanohalophilus sp. RSK TaxID=2485783 RepID=UPI00131491F9